MATKPNALNITHGLAQLGGGSKAEGGGMMAGMENNVTSMLYYPRIIMDTLAELRRTLWSYIQRTVLRRSQLQMSPSARFSGSDIKG